jgi:hypothetical protein
MKTKCELIFIIKFVQNFKENLTKKKLTMTELQLLVSSGCLMNLGQGKIKTSFPWFWKGAHN